MHKPVPFLFHCFIIFYTLFFVLTSVSSLYNVQGSTTYGPNPRYEPQEILRYRNLLSSDLLPFEGIPLSVRPDLKYIEISGRRFVSGAQLLDSLEGCVNLEELRLENIILQSGFFDVGSRRVYLPALQVYILKPLVNLPVSDPSQLLALLPFYKVNPAWNISQLLTLGVNIQVPYFEFNYKTREIHAERLPFLIQILSGSSDSHYTQRELTISTKFVEPSKVPTDLTKLVINTGELFDPNVTRAIFLRTQKLEELELRFHGTYFSSFDKIELDINLLPKDTLKVLELTNAYLLQSNPKHQFKDMVKLDLTTCEYNDSFIQNFDITFYHVAEVRMHHEVAEPWRDQQLLAKLFNTKVKITIFSPFNFKTMNEYFNFNCKYTNHEFIQELRKIGDVKTEYDGLQLYRRKYESWPFIISSASNIAKCKLIDSTCKKAMMTMIILTLDYFSSVL